MLQATTELLDDAVVRDGLTDHGAQAEMVGVSRTSSQRAALNVSNQNRNVPFLTKLEMAPFCVFRLFVLVHFFCPCGFF